MDGCCTTPVGKWIVAGDRNISITNPITRHSDRTGFPALFVNHRDTNVACAIDGLAPTTDTDSLFVAAVGLRVWNDLPPH